jgi:hypothetical protein
MLARGGVQPARGRRGHLRLVWVADTSAATRAEVHLAHPLGVKAFTYRRVKNDERDCADLLRLGRLAEARVRPAAGPRAVGADPVADQAGADAVISQGPGARGAGQAPRRPPCSMR